ncbi:MAG: response regulator [Planctomycetales bacterium]|nr:response regulator [Planctomycetales bacterium]
MAGETVQILLVEDDEIDAETVKRAFSRQKIANPITVARDGVAALSRLRGEDGAPPFERPYLILLDLNMPRMNGTEFLEQLRADPSLCDSVVFVLTTSKSDRDITAAYERQISGYLVKSNIGHDFVNLVGMLEHFWRYVEFPRPR